MTYKCCIYFYSNYFGVGGSSSWHFVFLFLVFFCNDFFVYYCAGMCVLCVLHVVCSALHVVMFIIFNKVFFLCSNMML